jgi:LCP family protein required for cell wall assembly
MSYARHLGPRSGLPALALSAFIAVSGSLAAPAAAQLSGGLLEAGIAHAASHPGLVQVVRQIEGSQAITRGKDGRVTVLLLGSDYRPSLAGERTDTIVVMTINPKTKAIAAVSIPRDISRLRLPNGQIFNGRINSMYAYYRKQLGSPAASLNRVKQIVEHNLQIEIDYYALIRMPAFNELVDHVGGLTVRVPSELKDPKFWDDPRGPQGIFFPASSAWPMRGNTTLCNGHYKTGKLSLPGAKCQRALVYVRSRKGAGNSDFKRTLRAQDVVFAAITKVGQRGTANLTALRSAAGTQISRSALITNVPRTAGDALEMYNLLKGSKLANKVVLSPTKYATKNVGSATYTLNLTAVRALTKQWFAPVP